MQTKHHSRSFGVLEIILSTAILAAFSVFAIQLFLKASRDQTDVVLLDKSTYAAVSIAEQFKSGGSPFDLAAKYGGSVHGNAYSKKVDISSGLRAGIVIRQDDSSDIADSVQGGLYSIEITMSRADSGSSVYRLSALKYFDQIK